MVTTSRSSDSGFAELATQYAKLTGSALRTQWRLARDYAEASARLARERPSAAVAARSARTAREEAARWWSDAAALALDYGQAVVELNRDTGERLLRTVTAEQLDSLSLHVSAASGETVREAVTLANTASTPQLFTFAPGPMRDDAGRTVVAAWSFEPAEVEVDPGEEQRVVMVLPLHEDVFPSGTAWSGAVDVREGNEVVLQVHVDLTVS